MNTVLFNKNYLFIFLIEFSFNLLFLIIFTCIHYGITNSTKWGQKLQKSKSLNFWYFFVAGFILSLATFIVSQISSKSFGYIGMPLTILGLIYSMTIFYNKSIQLGAFIPTIFWILYQYDGFYRFDLSWFLRIIAITVMAGVAIGTTFIKWKKWPKFLLSCLTTFILLLVIVLSNFNDKTLFNSISCIVALLSMIFYYAVIDFLNRWLTHMSRMAKQGIYVDKHYLIPNVLSEYFLDFVRTNNINQALILSFDFIGASKEQKIVLDKIYKKFLTEKTLFFKSSYGTYGLILSGPNYYVKNLNKSYLGNKTKNRDINDDLKYLEQQIKSLKVKNLIVNAYVSIYGVHSCQLDILLKNNYYACKFGNHEKSHNFVQLFNANILNQKNNDETAFATLNQKVNINDITVELELFKIKKIKTTYVYPKYYWAKMLTCDIDAITSQFSLNIANTLLRYLASKSLEIYAYNQEYRQYPILINYPIDQLNSNEWSTNELVKKISLFGLDLSNVTLLFNAKKHKKWPETIIKNLFDLQQHNVKYILTEINNIKNIRHLKPIGVSFNSNLINTTEMSKTAKLQKFNIL